MMRQFFCYLLILPLASCTNVEATESHVVPNTKVPTASILPSLTFVPSLVPSITPSITPASETPCDPLLADFCISDGHFLLQRPIWPPANDRIDPSYRYGSTANGTREPHHGVEFPNASGTPVHAAAEGTVIFAGPDRNAVYSPWQDFYGNLVVIEHSHDLFTLYAHLSKIYLAEGQRVLAGDPIGEVGKTGGAIGSHLHFEVRSGNVADYFATQNPELWLASARDTNGNPFGTLMITAVDQDGKLLEKANFTVGYYSDPSQSPIEIYYATPYSSDLLIGEESAALSELQEGHYRIAVETKGRIQERWVEVQSGKLTQVVFVVK